MTEKKLAVSFCKWMRRVVVRSLFVLFVATMAAALVLVALALALGI